jgi:ParB family chromosome partitioning protein
MNEIELQNIEVNPFQPRKHFDDDAIAELAASIKQLGVIQPITVRKLSDHKYQLITGERRLRASKLAGIGKIPAYVRHVDDQDMLALALVENIQRQDLNPIEISISYQRLMDECNLTQETMSERVGKSRATVANYLRLLKLPAEIQFGIRQEKISMGHAKALLGIEIISKQLGAYHKIIDEDLSVRATEVLVRNLTATKNPSEKKDTKENNNEYNDLREHISKYFKLPVELKRNENGNGKLIISFKSDDELEKILALLDAK